MIRQAGPTNARVGYAYLHLIEAKDPNFHNFHNGCQITGLKWKHTTQSIEPTPIRYGLTRPAGPLNQRAVRLKGRSSQQTKNAETRNGPGREPERKLVRSTSSITSLFGLWGGWM